MAINALNPAASRARLWSVQTDAMLCRAGRRGNENAFEELYRRHHRQLSAFVFHLLGGRHRREDTEEIVQDAFTRAFAAVRERGFSGSFRQWLFVIARNRAIDQVRGERLELIPLETDGLAETPRAPAAEEPPAAVERRADLEWLVTAISELPERQRSALLLRELGGLSHDEIARAIEASPGSVRQLISRGRDNVRSAAGTDPAASSSLRRGLLDAAPIVPVGAFGVGSIVASGAGAGTVIATGKLAAALATVVLIAGAANTIDQQVAGAREDPVGAKRAVSGESTPAASGKDSPSGDAKSRAGDGIRATSPDAPERERPIGTPDKSGDEPAGAAEGQKPAADKSPSSKQSDDPSQGNESPLQPVVELPGKVVENVGETLDGSKPVLDTVGDTVHDTVDAVVKTVDGVIKPLTKR